MSTSLVADLRAGREEVAGALPAEESAPLAHARDSSASERAERDRRLKATVLSYRQGPRELWAAILLDLLAPALLARIQRLRAEPPVLDEQDVRQQLVLELLRAAATMPLPAEDRYVKAALIARANHGVSRWLAREARRQMNQRPFEVVADHKR